MVEKKVTLMVREMRRSDTFAAAVSQTKKLGNNTYEVEHTILHSGRVAPGDGEQNQKDEDVGLVLSPDATKSWRQDLHLVSVFAPNISNQ